MSVLNSDILIIGAGAAGLMAAYTLGKNGKKVIVLEARERCGGRIHTLHHELFFKSAELGAEFIHGDLPVTMNLLKEAGINTHPAGAKLYRHKNGKFLDGGFFNESWDVLGEKLKNLQRDTTISKFLDKEFKGSEYEDLRDRVTKFAAGFDTADPEQASAFALRDEWLDEEDENQYRVTGGYGRMINFLEDEIKAAGGVIFLNSIAKKIEWRPGNVEVSTADGQIYQANKLILALPLGILHADSGERAAISIQPNISKQIDALGKMGYGAIVKILLEFDEPFWEDKQTEAMAGRSLKDIGFVISDEAVPTWWTQMPQRSTLLTGWLGGEPARKKKLMTDEELLSESLKSLSNIFKRNEEELKGRLVSFHIVNWTNDPFSLGSYTYDTIYSAASRKVLEDPVEDTIYFAGEYLYDGVVMGTVEAALSSGKKAAEKMLNV